MKKLLGLAVAIGAVSVGANAQSSPYPSVAKAHADPVAAFQGEWVSRMCNEDHRWLVEGRNVKMYKHDPNRPATDYNNRHAEGSVMYIIRDEFDRNDRGIRMNGDAVDPKSGRVGEGSKLALTIYWTDFPNLKGEYFGFNDMVRPEKKAKMCTP